MNNLLSQIKSPKTIALADKVRRMEREGKKVIKFQTGDPGFKTHEIVSEAMRKAVARGETHYTNSQGIQELREAIACYEMGKCKIPVDPNVQVVVTSGGAQAVFLALLALLNPSDEVILFEPYYPQYEYIIRLLGGVVRTIPASFNASPTYSINPQDLESAINERTKAVIINSPNNPSGKILSGTEIEKIIEITDKEKVYILSDEVYFKIVDEGKKHYSLLEYPKVFDRLIYINSFSKTFAMSGWRLGYIISQQWIIERILKLLQLNITCVPAFVQHAGVAALESRDVREYTVFMAAQYNERRKLIYNLIKDYPLFGIYPDGAFYYLLRLPGFSPDEVDRWADRLLEKELVAIVPAHVYGNSVGSFFRISFSIDSDSVVDGIKRIIGFLYPQST